MERKNKSLYQSATQVWENVVSKENNCTTKKLELPHEFPKKLLIIAQIGKTYHMFFNLLQMELEEISPEISNVLGYQPEEINALFFLDQIHPDDKPYFLNFETYIIQFFNDLTLERRGSYKYQHDYRIRTKSGDYIRLLHQILPFEYDERNYYKSLVLHTDITHIKKEGTPCFSIIGFDNEPSYFNIETSLNLTKSFEVFSKREKEVLKCIVEGKDSRTIAKELFISIHTVNTHRKNILIKADCKRPIELIAKVIKGGYV